MMSQMMNLLRYCILGVTPEPAQLVAPVRGECRTLKLCPYNLPIALVPRTELAGRVDLERPP